MNHYQTIAALNPLHRPPDLNPHGFRPYRSSPNPDNTDDHGFNECPDHFMTFTTVLTIRHGRITCYSTPSRPRVTKYLPIHRKERPGRRVFHIDLTP